MNAGFQDLAEGAFESGLAAFFRQVIAIVMRHPNPGTRVERSALSPACHSRNNLGILSVLSWRLSACSGISTERRTI